MLGDRVSARVDGSPLYPVEWRFRTRAELPESHDLQIGTQRARSRQRPADVFADASVAVMVNGVACGVDEAFLSGALADAAFVSPAAGHPPGVGAEVVYVRSAFPRDARLANWPRNRAAVEGSPGADFDARLAGSHEPVFAKRRSDAFSNAHLDRYFRSRGIDHLVLAGARADSSVYFTALGAMNRGYKLKVVTDAIAAQSDRRRNAALDGLVRRAEVADSEVTLAIGGGASVTWHLAEAAWSGDGADGRAGIGEPATGEHPRSLVELPIEVRAIPDRLQHFRRKVGHLRAALGSVRIRQGLGRRCQAEPANEASHVGLEVLLEAEERERLEVRESLVGELAHRAAPLLALGHKPVVSQLPDLHVLDVLGDERMGRLHELREGHPLGERVNRELGGISGLQEVIERDDAVDWLP
jgi:nicotinamidase-related amidase